MNNFLKSFLFSMLLLSLSFLVGCQSSKSVSSDTRVNVSQEVKDFAYTIVETSLDYAVAKAEQEIKPFVLPLKRKQVNQLYLSPLGFVKFEVKEIGTSKDSLFLNISPVWLTIADSCKNKINHYLKNENELLKLVVNTSIKRAINKASKLVLPYHVKLNRNDMGQFLSPHRLLLIELREGKENLLVQVTPNIAEMGEIIKRLVKESLETPDYKPQ